MAELIFNIITPVSHYPVEIIQICCSRNISLLMLKTF